MTKEEKRIYKIDLRNFLHGIVEQNFKRTEYSIRNGTLKKAKVWRQSEEWKVYFFIFGRYKEEKVASN